MAIPAGMSAAEQAAYEAAEALIAKAAQEGSREISFDREEFRALTHIPPELSELMGLTHLDLSNTKVSDLSPIRSLTGLHHLSLNHAGVSDLAPIRDMTALRFLSLDQTGASDLSPIRNLTGLDSLFFSQTGVRDLSPVRGLAGLQLLSLAHTGVSDLSPIRGLTALQHLFLKGTSISELSPIHGLTGLRNLHLDQTAVSDLSPIRDLMRLQNLFLAQTGISDLRPALVVNMVSDGQLSGLWFANTPAVQLDERLARLAEIADDKQRTKEVLDYLKTLPPWPEPLPWLTPPPSTPRHASDRKPARQDPPLTRAGAAPTTPVKHIKFLLDQPRLTQFTAREVAGQIRWALKDVKRSTNALPEPFATIEEIADALDDLGNARLAPKKRQRVDDMKLRIAQLEAMVERLTAQLADSEKARETAEALAKSQGLRARFSEEMAVEGAKTIWFSARAGIAIGMIYFLGPSNATVLALLGALEALK